MISLVYASAYVDNIDVYSFSPQPKLDWMIISPLESNHCSCVQPISVLHCTATATNCATQCFCSCHMQPSSGGWASEQVLVAAGVSQHGHLMGTLSSPPALIRRTLSWVMDEGGITSHHANRGQARAVTSDKVQLSDWSWIEWNLPPDTGPACTPHKLHYWTDAIRCMEAERGEKDGGFCCVKLQTARISEAGIILLPAVMCCSISTQPRPGAISDSILLSWLKTPHLSAPSSAAAPLPQIVRWGRQETGQWQIWTCS